MTKTTYIAYSFRVKPLQPATEILIAELGVAGFDSFLETDFGVVGYIQNANWNRFILEEIRILNSSEFDIDFTIEEIEQKNWNEEWEQNFKPILIENKCAVRAPFHKPFDVEYDIVIEPKMSFGTGHHETTFMMIKLILVDAFSQKSVLDMGTGTGVLAILASFKDAEAVDAIDCDIWSYKNALENIKRNMCNHINVYKGDASLLINKYYDVIFANINRNILLKDIKSYASCLNKNGSLYLSGFYTEDIPAIETECNKQNLKLIKKIERNNWVALKFIN